MASTDINPYAPPQSVSEAAIVKRPRRIGVWSSRLLVLQALVMFTALLLEFGEHESIVGSGPIFALVGFVIAVVAWRSRDVPMFFYGVSAIAFAALIVFLITWNGWSPKQGNAPITKLMFAYAAVAFPATYWLYGGLPIRRPETRKLN